MTVDHFLYEYGVEMFTDVIQKSKERDWKKKM